MKPLCISFFVVLLSAGCSGDTKETGEPDGDGDGYSAAEDCDDGNAAINPGATELCDGVDNNCENGIDEDTAEDAATWYADSDGDSYGDSADSVNACEAPAGYVTDNTDCDDSRDDVNPAGTEVCDDADSDEDCDGNADDDDAQGADGQSSWYADSDGDSYGNAADSVNACEARYPCHSLW